MTVLNPIPDIVYESDLFDGIDSEIIEKIFSHGYISNYESGESLFQEGDEAEHCHFILKGRLSLRKLHFDGKEAIIRYIKSGELTAAVSVLKRKFYPVTAEVIEPSQIIVWNRLELLEFIKLSPEFAVNILGLVVSRMDNIQNRYLQLQTERVELRLARTLLQLMEQAGSKTSTETFLNLKLSRKELADYTGTTLYTISRILSEWGNRGWISSGREKIEITNSSAIKQFLEKG